jgi:hypothetical protein
MRRGRALLDWGWSTGGCVAAGSTRLHMVGGEGDWAAGRPDACAVRSGWARCSPLPSPRMALCREAANQHCVRPTGHGVLELLQSHVGDGREEWKYPRPWANIAYRSLPRPLYRQRTV